MRLRVVWKHTLSWLSFFSFFLNAFKYAGYGLRLFSFPPRLGGAVALWRLSVRHVCCRAPGGERPHLPALSGASMDRPEWRCALCYSACAVLSVQPQERAERALPGVLKEKGARLKPCRCCVRVALLSIEVFWGGAGGRPVQLVRARLGLVLVKVGSGRTSNVW